MTGTRNPSRKYFKRNQPYFYKSADNWEEWDTDESYDRTFFIGIDDTNPADIDVALYMIWGGKPVAAVGSKVLDTVSEVVDTAKLLETEIQSILKEVQELSAKVAQSAIDIEQAITEMNALVDRCEGILDGAEAARDLAKDWANKMDGTVDGTEYSAKYYANEAKNSETAAAGSATTASASATTATEQATAAATSAEQAATSASTAASYASTAHIDASGAANSAQAAQDSATSAANSATNAANSETNSANSATASATSASNSHIWAEGTDEQVQALGGVHSSKVWAEQSTNANISLTNSPYTTNRILEIPQDIKLELNNGTLTLKAGSKVYVPNGFEADGTTPKFDVVNVQSDISLQSYNGTYTECVVLKSDTLLDSSNITKCFSGNSVPSFTGSGVWYDKANNVCKRSADGGSTWETCSFPLCLCNVVSALRTSIDQVFNGFGYIGSTVFALPGIKVQAPNGRNEDGTYRVIPYTTQNVITREVTGTGVKDITLQPNGILNQATSGLYLAEDGYHRGYTGSSTKNIAVVLARVLITTAGKIDNFVPRNVDSVANSNASNFSQAGRSEISRLSSISKQGIQLTLGADGSQYVMPANGRLCLKTEGGHCQIYVNAAEHINRVLYCNSGSGAGTWDSVVAKVTKGDVVTIYYSGSNLRFYLAYDNGEV